MFVLLSYFPSVCFYVLGDLDTFDSPKMSPDLADAKKKNVRFGYRGQGRYGVMENGGWSEQPIKDSGIDTCLSSSNQTLYEDKLLDNLKYMKVVFFEESMPLRFSSINTFQQSWSVMVWYISNSFLFTCLYFWAFALKCCSMSFYYLY